MTKNQSLMTEKEKSYVSLCFNKNIRVSSANIALDKIFRGEKITVDMQNSKKEIKRVFGKLGKRSKKWQRPSVNSDTSFMNVRSIISDLFDTNMILKYVTLDEEAKEELEESSILYFSEHLQEISIEPKIYSFIKDFLNICSDKSKNNILKIICQHITAFNQDLLLISFKNISEEKKLDLKFEVSDVLWQSEIGYTFGIFLIQNSLKIAENLLESFITSNVKVEKSFYKFVNLLYAVVSPNSKSKLKKKIKNIENLEISNLVKDLSIH